MIQNRLCFGEPSTFVERLWGDIRADVQEFIKNFDIFPPLATARRRAIEIILILGFKTMLSIVLGQSMGSPVLSDSAGSSTPPQAPTPSSVDLSVGGSLHFPDGNMLRADIPSQQLALQQSWTNTTNQSLFFNNDSDGLTAVFVKLRLDSQAIHLNNRFAIVEGMTDGNDNFWMRYDGSDHAGARSIQARLGSSNGTARSLPIDEDEILVVASITASRKAYIDWYGPDGTRHAGPLTSGNVTPVSFGASFQHLTIGASASPGGSPAPGDGTIADTAILGFPGEISAIGFAFSGTEGEAIPQSVWSDIATGTDLQTALAGRTVQYVREFDGTANSLAAPSWATGDLSAPTAVWPNNDSLAPGGSIGRSAATDWLVPDRLASGHVYGVVPGETSRQVALPGTADTSLNGQTVRARLIYENGDVAVDWTDLGAVSGGAWSGAVTVPFALDRGWIGSVQYAVGAGSTTVVYDDRTRWGVGFKFLQLGQSQTSIAMTRTSLRRQLPQAMIGAISFGSGSDDAGTGALQLVEQGGRTQADAVTSFAEQMYALGVTCPMSIIADATVGTGPNQLISDSSSGRDWSELQSKLDTFGNDISAVLMNWITAGWTQNGTVAETMEALIYGTGGYGGTVDHHLSAALRPGFAFVLSPGTRNSRDDEANKRSAQVAYANAASLTVGPPVSDFFIEQSGGPHQDVGEMGDVIFGVRQALGAAKAMGVAVPDQPHFTNVAWGADQSQIMISVALPNGGALSSPAPAALRSFSVDDGGTGSFTTTGFTAAISGNQVVLTKNSGTWAAGTHVSYASNLATRADGDALEEAAIINGALYETWADDPVGLGLPVLGSLSGDDWVPDWTAEVQ